MVRGSIAPPYTWAPRERDDWEYRSPLKTNHYGESVGLQQGAPPDPAKARIDSLRQQIAKLREEIKQLMDRQRTLVQSGKQHLTPKPPVAPTGHWKGSAHAGYPEPKSRTWGAPVGLESLTRSGLKLTEAQISPPIQFATPEDPHIPAKIPMPRGPNMQQKMNKRERWSQLSSPKAPSGLSNRPAAPPQSAELIRLHQQIKSKRDQIAMLVDQLRRIRMQGRSQHESTGLVLNRRNCLRLLLK